MAETAIEWTATRLPDSTTLPGYTFNPWEGCQKIGPGCDHLHARRQLILANLDQLRGHDLCCWCKPGQPCHGDVLLRLANGGGE